MRVGEGKEKRMAHLEPLQAGGRCAGDDDGRRGRMAQWMVR